MFYLICNTAKFIQLSLRCRGISLPALSKNARAQGMVEYALILVLVAMLALIALRLLGPLINGVILKVGCGIDPNFTDYAHFVDVNTGDVASCDD